MTNSSTAKALLFGLLAAFFWGTHSVIVRYLTADLNGMSIAVFRLYIAAFVLYVIMEFNRHSVRTNFADRTFMITALAAALNFAFFHIGLEYTSASNAMMLENTAPFFVLAFLLFIFREKVGAIEIAATVIAITGVYLTVRHDFDLGGGKLTGDILELLAGLTWAVFIMGSSKVLSGTKSAIERVNFLFNVFIVSAIALTPFAFFHPISVTTTDVILLVLLGVFPTALAYYLWYEAAARVSTVTAALLFTLSIIFTFVNAHIFLGEVLTTDMLLGAALIVAGVMLSKWGGQRS